MPAVDHVSKIEPGWLQPSGAVEVLPADAQTTMHDQWCAARQDGIGGSDIATILGINGYESLFGLWLDKTGRRGPKPETPLMKRGRYLEPALVQFFSDETGISCRRTGTWVVDGAEWMRCNPDRLTSDGGVAEVKAPGGRDWAELWKYGPALHAVIQNLWEQAVLGAGHGYVIADGGPDGLWWWRIDRDERLDRVIDWAAEVGYAWWEYHVMRDNPPEVDGSEATTLAIKQSSKPPAELADRVVMPGSRQLANRRNEIKRILGPLSKELKEIENQLKAAAIGAETICDEDGAPVIKWAWVALDSPHIEPYRKFTTPGSTKK